MARTERDLEAYLSALNKRYELLPDSTYALDLGEGAPAIALRVMKNIVVFRVLIGEAPRDEAAREALVFRRLLELNASELVYSAYGLENNHIVLAAALEIENLDLNELEAVLDDIELAMARHIPSLRQLCKG